jgi:hypothetical protein
MYVDSKLLRNVLQFLMKSKISSFIRCIEITEAAVGAVIFCTPIATKLGFISFLSYSYIHSALFEYCIVLFCSLLFSSILRFTVLYCKV